MNAEGVVAIDTVVSERGPCSETLSDCDFELGMCGWKDDSSFPLEWARVQAMNGAPLIAYDHTTNTETGEVWICFHFSVFLLLFIRIGFSDRFMIS